MKKSLMLFGILLGVVATSYAEPVKLPNRDVLAHRLREKDFGHFIEKTDLIATLADQEKEALGVITAVELAFCDYKAKMQNPMIEMMMQMRKPELIETILNDYPEAIKEAQGFLAEIEKR